MRTIHAARGRCLLSRRRVLLTGLVAVLVATGCAAGPETRGAPRPSAAPASPAPATEPPLSVEPGSPSEGAMQTATVRVGDLPPLRVEVARTQAERERGLSGRGRLAPGTGMLFVFDEPTTTGFWMHDVYFPLSLAWVRNGHVIGTVEMVPCRSDDPDDCRVYEPPAPYEMVIEAPAKTFAGVERGAPVQIKGLPR